MVVHGRRLNRTDVPESSLTARSSSIFSNVVELSIRMSGHATVDLSEHGGEFTDTVVGNLSGGEAGVTGEAGRSLKETCRLYETYGGDIGDDLAGSWTFGGNVLESSRTFDKSAVNCHVALESGKPCTLKYTRKFGKVTDGVVGGDSGEAGEAGVDLERREDVVRDFELFGDTGTGDSPCLVCSQGGSEGDRENETIDGHNGGGSGVNTHLGKKRIRIGVGVSSNVSCDVLMKTKEERNVRDGVVVST